MDPLRTGVNICYKPQRTECRQRKQRDVLWQLCGPFLIATEPFELQNRCHSETGKPPLRKDVLKMKAGVSRGLHTRPPARNQGRQSVLLAAKGGI